jgi:hypothetical protein
MRMGCDGGSGAPCFPSIQCESSVRFTREQCFAGGSIALSLALAFAGVFELCTGEFMPGGYHNDRPWMGSSTLLRVFRDCGPYISGLIWLALAAVCFRMGMEILRDARERRRSRRTAL